MMNIFRNPGWVNQALQDCHSLDAIPETEISAIAARLKSVMSAEPLVTVIIAAWNEELNIVRCLDSLSRSKTSIAFDIIVVNNNSTDRTQQVLDRLGVTSYFQPVQGVGPSRELGQRQAKGKYILSADADCVYPDRWVELMSKTLMKPGNVFVYGRFSYLSDKNHSRVKLFSFELLRDMMAELRHIKRPHLNAYGISLGYVKELGMLEGHLDKNMRGFDGRLCFDIMKHGKVALVRSHAARAWTGTRALERDGKFSEALVKRVLRELARLDDYFSKHHAHNTKESKNADYSVENSIKTLKRKYNPLQLFKK
jgi:glycosyltransferase involved in cell wall biosynthesis